MLVQVIVRRGRKWRKLAGAPEATSLEVAKAQAALALLEHWVRASRVVASYEWYDPHVVFEAHRK